MGKNSSMKALKYKSDDKFQAKDVNEFANQHDGKEIWIVRVPVDFDPDELDTIKLEPNGTSNAASETFQIHEEPVSLVNSQISYLEPSMKHSNGLFPGSSFKRSFYVSYTNDDVASLTQQPSKTKEVLSILTVPRRAQIPFRMCYHHLGEDRKRDTSSKQDVSPKKRSRKDANGSDDKKKRKQSFEEEPPVTPRKEKKEKKEKKSSKKKK